MGFVTPDYGTIFWMLIIFGIVLFILKIMSIQNIVP